MRISFCISCIGIPLFQPLTPWGRLRFGVKWRPGHFCKASPKPYIFFFDSWIKYRGKVREQR